MARLVASALPETELLTTARLTTLLDQETSGKPYPDKAWGDLVTSVVARAALDHHLVIAIPGVEFLFAGFPALLRVRLAASAQHRAGAVQLERRLPRPQAEALLDEWDNAALHDRRRRFGKSRAPESAFDLTLNADSLAPEQMAIVIAESARALHINAEGLLNSTAEMHIQFQVRLRLAEHGVAPPGRAELKRRPFANRSEQIFSSLLDFYRIPWEYEPRSFPVAWDAQRQPTEHFTPDFYLPETGLYVELTTMKQSLVTKKNRKVKLLKELYPEINIQIFYQRDFQNLIFKHGLQEKPVTV